MNTNQIPDILKAGALFINEKGELLLSRENNSAKWVVLGGRIEKGEEPRETVAREMKEELDLDVEIEDKMYAESDVFNAANDPDKTVKLLYFFCKMMSEPKFIENVEELHWFSKDEMIGSNFEFSESVKKFLVPLLLKDNLLK